MIACLCLVGLGGAGSAPLFAIALLIASTVLDVWNATISRASSRFFFLSAIESPSIVAVPAFTRRRSATRH